MMMILYGMAHPFMWKSVRRKSSLAHVFDITIKVRKISNDLRAMFGLRSFWTWTRMRWITFCSIFLQSSQEKRGENQWNLARARINQKWATFLYCAESSNLKFKNLLWNSLGCFREWNSICFFRCCQILFLGSKLQSKSIFSSVPFAAPPAKQTLSAVGSSSSRFFRIKPKMNRKRTRKTPPTSSFVTNWSNLKS